jgi:hypothetical protein
LTGQEATRVIDEMLKEFLQAEVTTYVGTRAADLTPEVSMGWGIRVLEGGREVDIFIDRAAGARTLENLRTTRLIAVTCASAITFQTVQVKGLCTEIDSPSPDDLVWVNRHREAYAEAVRFRAIPPQVSRSTWSREVMRVRFLVNELFDQTPGPGAGKKL